MSATALAFLVARVGLSVGLRARRLAAFVIVLAAAGAIGWEVVEYLGLFENLHFWGFDDAAQDLVADAAGILTALLLLRRRPVREVVDPDVDTLDALAETR